MAKQRKVKTKEADIAVVGGGPAGLVAALMLAQSGTRVVCFAPPPQHADLRTSALMQGSVAILKTIGVWDTLEPKSAPLRVMRLIDDTGRLLRAPSVEFNSSEIGDNPYGYNFKNSDLVSALREFASKTKLLTLEEKAVESIKIDTKHVTLVDAADRIWNVELIVAADGRNSICRKAAGIIATEKRLPQTALAFNIAHKRKHENISTEFHRTHGPLTFVPLPGNRSSVVWVESPDAAQHLLNMNKVDFLEDLQESSYGIMGDITEIGPIGSFPLSHLAVDTMATNRTVLVGEAGHVIPPIGAQGLNLGFRDAATIADLVRSAKSNGLRPDDQTVFTNFNRKRKSDIASRSKFVELLNRSVLSNFLPVQALRSVGLYALAKSNPLRQLAMKTGIGPLLEKTSKTG